MLGISPLAFALGMYLPMEINTSILLGAIVAKLVDRGARDERVLKARTDKGILVASGLIAGAAILEVVVSLIGNFSWGEKLLAAIDINKRFIEAGADPAQVMRTHNWIGLAAFLALCLFVYWNCRRAKPETVS
jgi:F0F1-type ATP synthase membrane subunit c/vacuolar-type H+-ATPase subunit K